MEDGERTEATGQKIVCQMVSSISEIGDTRNVLQRLIALQLKNGQRLQTTMTLKIDHLANEQPTLKQVATTKVNPVHAHH